jgi:hypothetical protein
MLCDIAALGDGGVAILIEAFTIFFYAAFGGQAREDLLWRPTIL